MAKAKVVILAGIQDANVTDELGNVFKIKSKITPYDLTMPAVQKRALKAPKATNHPYPPSGGTKISAVSGALS